MFTIKHIDDYGNEDLFQASSVRVVREHPDTKGVQSDGDGVKVDGIIGRDYDGAHYALRSHNEARANTGFEAAIFVMNENGATVAKYLL